MNTRVEQQVECASCPWDKLCIRPPSMTEAEVKEKMERERPSNPNDPKAEDGALLGSMLSAIFFAGKDRECIACTAFITKLRENPELSNRIRAIMQES